MLQGIVSWFLLFWVPLSAFMYLLILVTVGATRVWADSYREYEFYLPPGTVKRVKRQRVSQVAAYCGQAIAVSAGTLIMCLGVGMSLMARHPVAAICLMGVFCAIVLLLFVAAGRELQAQDRFWMKTNAWSVAAAYVIFVFAVSGWYLQPL